MAKRQFLTVPDELLGCVSDTADYLERYGYRIGVEKTEIDYPYTPALHCRRGRTTLFVEVDRRIDHDRLDEWAQFCKSCPTDTRIALTLPIDHIVNPADDGRLRQSHIGLFRAGGGQCIEVVPAMDLALSVALPPLRTLHPRLRSDLGAVYEKFNRSEWRDGFKAACQVVETEARKYLNAAVGTGRVSFVSTAGKPYSLTKERIDKMTIGKLAVAFGDIQKPNHADGVIGGVLALINPERVGATHHEQLGRTEAKLRKNVGRHMHRLVAALKALHGVK